MKPEDLKIEAGYRKQSGGQGISDPTTAVRVTHVPTGITASCETERSQFKNKAVCLSMIEWGLAEIGWKEAKHVR